MVKSTWQTTEDVKQNMKNGINNASASFNFGVQNPRRNPIMSAIEAIKNGIWSKNFKASIGKWEKNLSAISLEQWKTVTKESASRYAEKAATIGAGNYEIYYAKAESIIAAASAEFTKSQKTKEDTIKFWEAMSQLKNV
ncbi:TPA_asm: hypothetical protein [Altiarchaeum virus]|nr:TPA_asm: hypothetical protein [Altiarchaeum virus]